MEKTERMDRMKNETPAFAGSKGNTAQINKVPLIGFLCMLLGPLTLIITGLLTGVFGYLTETSAAIIAGVAIVFPGIGVVMSIISFFHWKKIAKPGHILAVVTVVMCNPLFYFFYYAICSAVGSELAGISWM